MNRDKKFLAVNPTITQNLQPAEIFGDKDIIRALIADISSKN